MCALNIRSNSHMTLTHTHTLPLCSFMPGGNQTSQQVDDACGRTTLCCQTCCAIAHAGQHAHTRAANARPFTANQQLDAARTTSERGVLDAQTAMAHVRGAREHRERRSALKRSAARQRIQFDRNQRRASTIIVGLQHSVACSLNTVDDLFHLSSPASRFRY